MKVSLKNQVAVVTGSAHRVGKSIALELASKGAHILVHYHSTADTTLEQTLSEIRAYGVKAHAVQADLSQPDFADSFLAALDQHFDSLCHILVNSASAFPPKGELPEVTLKSWDLMMSVNLRAPFLLTQALAPRMLKNDPAYGSIINICDRGVDGPWIDRPHHGISKAGLWALTQVTALTYTPHIRCNAIVPGPVMKTDDGMTDERWQEIGDSLPLKRPGTPEDVARAVAYLAEEDFINGALLHVNAGEHLSYLKA